MLSTDNIKFDKYKYGLGTQQPKDKVPYLIKSRSKWSDSVRD